MFVETYFDHAPLEAICRRWLRWIRNGNFDVRNEHNFVPKNDHFLEQIKFLFPFKENWWSCIECPLKHMVITLHLRQHAEVGFEGSEIVNFVVRSEEERGIPTQKFEKLLNSRQYWSPWSSK